MQLKTVNIWVMDSYSKLRWLKTVKDGYNVIFAPADDTA